MENTVGAVIVLYNPVFEDLKNAIDKLYPQVDTICLVDNSSDDNSNKIKILEKINYIPLCENNGIAKAQNIGIRYLQEKGCQFILFCDQDSSCEEGLVEKLVSMYLNLEENGYNISVVGPTPYNKNTLKGYTDRKEDITDVFETTVDGQHYHIQERFTIPSSYSLARATTFNEVGYMEEDLFIDGVDFEWCWRTRFYYNRKAYRVGELKFAHLFGEDTNLPINRSTSFRLYYQYRNFIRLARREYMPAYWKRKNLIKYIMKFFAYSIFLYPRFENFKQILKGITDGIKSHP